jgi:GNAT superfamily N-acetyltransferase
MCLALLEHGPDVTTLDLFERHHLAVFAGGPERRLEPHAHRQVIGLDPKREVRGSPAAMEVLTVRPACPVGRASGLSPEGQEASTARRRGEHRTAWLGWRGIDIARLARGPALDAGGRPEMIASLIKPTDPVRQEMICRLRDGSRVRVRPVRPDDKERLLEGLRRLSPLSRYRRFHAAVATLSDGMLRDLTEIDHVNHIAWVASAVDMAGEPGIGVARCIRLARDPRIAELALTVVDSHQGRGLGTLLLDLLTASAGARGIRAFRADVLDDNAPMLRMLRARGAIERRIEPGVLRLEIPIRAERAPAATLRPSRDPCEASAARG